MSMVLTINGVDFVPFVDITTINIAESTQANGSSMSFDISIQTGDATPPVGGQEIIFEVNSIREFAGRIIHVQDELTTSDATITYHCQCNDYTADFDSQLIQTTIGAQLAGDEMRALVAYAGRGFTSNHVLDGPTVAETKPDLELISATASKISEAIQYQWYIDYYRDMHFFPVEALDAPVDPVAIDTDITSYFDLTIDEDISQVKNVIYLDGAKVKSGGVDSIHDTSTADGSIKFWPLNYEPWDPSTTTITVDDIPQNILLDGVDGQAGDGQGNAGDVYLCLDNWGVRFPDNHPPGDEDSSTPVDIGYAFATNPVIVVEDPDSIAEMLLRENTPTAPSNGRHEMKFTVPELRVESETSIYDYGTLILARYSRPLYTLRWTSWVQGWAAGQSLRMYSVKRRAFDRTVYVHHVTKTVLRVTASSIMMQYVLEGSTSPFPD